MYKILFSLFGVTLVAVYCTSLKPGNAQDIHQQGIEGYVYRLSGNQMPSPGAKAVPRKGIKTFLYIYLLTHLDQVDRQGQSAFYRSVKTKFITRVETDSNGYFKINLDPGRYSLFSKKDALFFANWFDKDNSISPVEVFPEKFSKVEFTVDYDAVY
jgi:hypothetical protein